MCFADQDSANSIFKLTGSKSQDNTPAGVGFTGRRPLKPVHQSLTRLIHPFHTELQLGTLVLLQENKLLSISR